MAIEYRTRQVTVDEFFKMAEFGILGPDERVELLDGEMVVMPPIEPRHNSVVLRMSDVFIRRLDGRALVLVQGSIHLSDVSAPHPDFVVLRPMDDYYASRAAAPSDVLALIEVSDSTIAYDRGKKLRAYARAGIVEYWIADVRKHRIERYLEPNDLGYAKRSIYATGDVLVFDGIPGIEFKLDELLGPSA